MNRKNLTAAVLAGLAGAAGIAGTAQAVNLNPDGLGQVLIYPYYTTRGGNLTTLSVVNTSEEAKAVKVRFLEGQNSREVLDFNLYMSAYDVWVAAIVDVAGTPTLMIDDTTCTVPYLYGDFGGTQAFLTYGLGDGGSEDINRAREGHFEMIEMGTLVGNSATNATHVAGAPAGCDVLVAAWTQGPDNIFGSADDGYWIDPADGPLTDIEAPSGGLFGGAAIVNPDQGTMYSYDARALNGFAAYEGGDDGDEILHSFPGTLLPSLNSGNGIGTGDTGRVFTQDGYDASQQFADGVDAVSYVFMHDSLMNEYVTGGSTSGASEWVLTFPTKNFYVNGAEAMAPFTTVWTDNDGDSLNDGACEVVVLDTIWDQEEREPGTTTGPDVPPIVSPAPEDPNPDPSVPFELCYETNVIRFGANPGAATEILGSENFTNINNNVIPDGAGGAFNFMAGWARIDLLEYPVDTNDDDVFDDIDYRDYVGYDGDTGDGQNQWGLPVTGFWVFEANNGYLTDDAGNSVLANYGGLWNHKTTRCFYGELCRENFDLVK